MRLSIPKLSFAEGPLIYSRIFSVMRTAEISKYRMIHGVEKKKESISSGHKSFRFHRNIV